MTLCQAWKKKTTSGPKLHFKCCTGCGVNMERWSMLSRRCRPCSASARSPNDLFFSMIVSMTWTQVLSKPYLVSCSAVFFQLVDMQWKLGMAVSSDTCRSLNSPYVCLLLKIVEPSGHICQRSFEMTVPQFQVCIYWCECSVCVIWCFGSSFTTFSHLQNFHKQFKEMAAVMETVWCLQTHLVTHQFPCKQVKELLSKTWIQMTATIICWLQFYGIY